MSASLLERSFNVVEERGTGVVTLYLSGDLDIEGATQLQARLSRLPHPFRGRVVIDLQGLDFLASAGIAVLVATEAYARRDGWVLQLRQGGPAIRRTFELCGLLGDLPFTGTGS